MPPGAGYWHTSGTQIIDTQGNPVRIRGVTWYGMESSHWVPAGMEFQRYTSIMDEIKLLGFNTIRLPFSNELVERNPVVRDTVDANPDLQGKRALDVMDSIVKYAQAIGLKIILDNHRSHASRPLYVNMLDETLWYTPHYPESAWIADWQALARRYAGNDAVIGFDLRNEPHTGGAGPYNLQAYRRQGATWGPTSGASDPATDWRLAAERAGNAVLAINPNLLIIVQGMELYPTGKSDTVTSSWWAGLLSPIKRYPVQLSLPYHLVYSVHEWGPRKSAMPWFKNMSYATLTRAWHTHWAFLLDHPTAPYAAPLWIGEFGTCNDAHQCIDQQAPGNQAMWFQSLMRFLREHPEVNWSFYALNGTNANRCRTDNGLLNDKWNRLTRQSLQSSFATIGASPPPPKGLLVPNTQTPMQPRRIGDKLCQLP